MGGPILKDRLFYFGDFEMRRDASESTELRAVPSESFRQGIIRYRTTVNTIATITPEQFRNLDPAGIGANPSILRYFGKFPAANEINSGDGLNTVGLRFNAPIGVDNKLYTGRIDYKLTSDWSHAIFWRGSLGDIAADQIAATYPGQPAASRLLNNSGGFTAGHTAQLSPSIVNSFRWGFTRQSVETSGAAAARFTIRNSLTNSFSDMLPTNSPAGRRAPIHEFKDDLSWIRGSHTVQAGGSVRFVRNDRFNFANSFPTYFSFQTDCAGFCREIATALQNDADPNNNPATPAQISDQSVILTGLITSVQATFLADPKAPQFLLVGSRLERSFAENGSELYLQDSWRIRPSLTVTAGIRYSYYTPIWERNGAQVRPDVDVRDYWNTLQANMYAGRPADSLSPLNWVLAGKANGAPSWYEPDRNNFAPRFSIAWTPVRKTVIRAGFGMYFNRVGGALGADVDDRGSPGVSSTLVTPTGQVTLATGRRFSGDCGFDGCTGLPSVTDFLTPPPNPRFPYTPPLSGRGAGFMVDNHLRSPYSMNLSFSIQHELPKSIVFDVGYVGVLGRKLLLKPDMGQFQGALRDPQSGQTFWDAQTVIANLIGDNPASPAIDYRNLDAVRAIGPIPFFENMMPNLPAFTNNPTLTPTQAFYLFQAPRAPDWARTTPPLDVNLTPGRSPWSRSVDPEQDGWVMSPRQFQALPAWTNAGSSNFHSLQVSARRNAGSAVFGINYVLSKSIDNSSQAENIGSNLVGMIPNAFFTGAARSISAFDVRHNLNAHWVWDIPVGHGRAFGSNWSGIADAVAGGWMLTGVTRWRSGLPVRLANGAGRATSVQLGGPGTAIGPLEADITREGPDGFPNIFSDPAAAFANVRATVPGGVGTQYPFYGPSFVTVDLGANKRFLLPWRDGHSVEFRATAFNALNHTNFRFDQVSGGTLVGFGRITETVGPRGGARELEFALRYEF